MSRSLFRLLTKQPIWQTGDHGTPIHTVIDTAELETTLVAAVAGRRLRILSLVLTSNLGPNVFALRNLVAGTRILGPISVADDTGVVLPYSPAGWGESAIGDGIRLNLGGATGAGGQLVYVEVE